jgi:predicted secreted Zn-dependent protease
MPVDFIGPEQVSRTVDGDTLAGVAQVVSQDDEVGKAEWFPRYEYELNGSALSSVTVTVATRITMPEWSGYGSASQAEKDEWDRFLAALQSHEQGHIDLVSQHLSNIDERMTGQSLNGAISTWKEALGDLALASDAYDRESDHGRNQGTIINLGVVTPAAE